MPRKNTWNRGLSKAEVFEQFTPGTEYRLGDDPPAPIAGQTTVKPLVSQHDDLLNEILVRLTNIEASQKDFATRITAIEKQLNITPAPAPTPTPVPAPTPIPPVGPTPFIKKGKTKRASKRTHNTKKP
jgi:hypothetical protein